MLNREQKVNCFIARINDSINAGGQETWLTGTVVGSRSVLSANLRSVNLNESFVASVSKFTRNFVCRGVCPKDTARGFWDSRG